jgi:hypothetical protein
MNRKGEMREEIRQIERRRVEVEISSRRKKGDRMAIEEDQNGVFWS